MCHSGELGVDPVTAAANYVKAVDKGLLKIMSKMGISTLRSYRSAQIFEAVGLNHELIEKFLPGTASRVEGIGLERHLEGIGLQEFYTVMDAFVGGFTHEGLHHSGRYIYAGDPASGLHGLGNGYGAVTGAACHVQDLLLGAVHNLLEGLLPPDIVNTQGHKVVKAVVGRRDVIEHLLYFLFLWHN
jgi:hypothetical protein